MIRLRNSNLGILRYNTQDYIGLLNNIIAHAFPGCIKSQPKLEDVILFLATVLGYITPEMFTSICQGAKLGSIRTKISELARDGYLLAIPICDNKQYGDSLINTIYVSTTKARKKLKTFYPNLFLRCYSNKRKTALHSYYNALLQLSLMTWMPYSAWQTEYPNEIHYIGEKYPRDVLIADTFFNYGGKPVFVEIDTGNEKNRTLIEKIISYYKHDNWIREGGQWSICFVFRKNRVTLAEKPRYKLSMLRVLRDFLHTDYARKRFTMFRDLADARLITNELSEKDRNICRAVIKDIIKNSPVDLDHFTVEDFDEYVTDVENHTSYAYYEDIARIHDHLCNEKITHIFQYYLEMFKIPNKVRDETDFLLNGRECFFVSLPRFRTALPYILFDVKLLDKNNISIKDRIASILERTIDDFNTDKMYYGFAHFSLDDIKRKEGFYCETVSFYKSFVDNSLPQKHYFCIENLALDLGARVRVVNILYNFAPKNHDVTIVLLVENRESLKKYDKIFGFSNLKRKNIDFRFLSMWEVSYIPDKAKLYRFS